MFPNGFPDEFTLIFTLALKKPALRETIYLFQISDQQGYPQVRMPPVSSPSALSIVKTISPNTLLFARATVPSLTHYRFPFTLFIDPSPFNHPTFFPSSLSLPLIPLFASSTTFAFDFFSHVTPFQFSHHFHHPLPFVLSRFSQDTPASLPVSLSPLPQLSLAFTFIVIHTCSVMKDCSPAETE